PAAVGRQVDAEERDLVCDLETLPRRGSFSKHLRSQIRNARLAGWISGASTAYEQHEVGKRELALLHDQQLEAVRYLPGYDRRQRYARWRSELGRLAAVESSLL